MAGPGEQLGEVRLEHTELVAPRVAHDPEVKTALLLVVIAGRAERAPTVNGVPGHLCTVSRDIT
jgi:hypothetical protein